MQCILHRLRLCFVSFVIILTVIYDSYTIRRKLVLKVSSDNAVVPTAFNILAVWCWVWASHFLVIDLINFLYVAFRLLHLIFTAYSLWRKYIKRFISGTNFSNILWKNDALSCSYRVRRWHPVLFTYSKLLLWAVATVF